MNPHRNRMAAAIASLLTCSLLAACGGGGGGVVRNSLAPQSPPPPGNPPAPPPPPPPPASQSNPCPMPISGDCVVSSKGLMLDDRDSAQALVVRTGAESLGIVGSTYRFAGGTRVESGGLSVGAGSAGNVSYFNPTTVLKSDVAIFPLASLSLIGAVEGNVENHGTVLLLGAINGNLRNDGRLAISAAQYEQPARVNIAGNFSQSSAGTLAFELAPAGWDSPAALTIVGSATLAGTLSLQQYSDAWGPYPLPTAGSHQILHANGGVYGTFDRWTSPGLFVEGSLRYGSNDVWFDLVRISVQAAMAGQGFGGIALASAGNLDRALAIADGFATAPNASQSFFLRSAGRLLWLEDAQQAARSLDSLAGSLHVDAADALTHDDALARGIGARTLALQPGDQAGAWSRLQGGDTLAGFDQWLSPRLLAGATAAQARDARRDALGGQSQHDSPQAALYLRWFGNNGWYAGGSAGYARHALALDRRIDLAAGGQWNAHAQRRLGIASFDAEVGRRFSAGGMTVAPYLWAGADAIRSQAAIEQGQTGFELTLQANTQASLDAGLGVRIGKRWSVGDSGWLAFDADARYRQRVMQSGTPFRAAFIGVPDAWFDVPGHEARSGTWLDLGLRGGFGRGWGWSLGHAGSLAGQANGRHWQVGLARRF